MTFKKLACKEAKYFVSSSNIKTTLSLSFSRFKTTRKTVQNRRSSDESKNRLAYNNVLMNFTKRV